MMGTGLAAGFIPGMKLIAVMFRRKVFTTYNALFAGIGNLSCLVGTVRSRASRNNGMEAGLCRAGCGIGSVSRLELGVCQNAVRSYYVSNRS